MSFLSPGLQQAAFYNRGMQPGQRLGPYEIVSRIGAGGMGVVWRASDTRLDRQVAIKVLNPEFAQSPVFRQRFEREAKTISSLNHPHICTLFDVGVEEGVSYLVMELLEGESLADRLARGALPLPEVFRIGVQVAEALDRAHRQHIVHRDLKPGNVMLTRSGAKLLDFGLAKSGVVSVSHDEATQQKPLTQEGTILGTFQYMAPEQLEGEEADSRSDLFALGTLLYEMATGRPAFIGKNRTSLIAAIVGGQPAPIQSLQPLTPPALEHVIEKCLSKDPEDRWQSAHDVAEELKWIAQSGSGAASGAPLTNGWKSGKRLWMSVAALLALSVAALLAFLLRPHRTAASRFVAEVNPPTGLTFRLEKDDAASLSVSPDGRWIVFSAASEREARDAVASFLGARNVQAYDAAKGKAKLWIRRVDSLESHAIEGTENGAYPFWSPDGRSLGFFADGKMKRIDLAGGPPTTICDVGDARGGSWGIDGTIIFEPRWQDGLFRIPATGGKAEAITRLDAARSETTHRYPWFLPDGKHYLFLAGAHRAEASNDQSAIYAGELGKSERKLVLRTRSNVIYANGYLLFLRQNYLLAQPFDLKKLELTGEPVKLATDVHYERGFFRGVFGAGGETLAWHPGEGDTRQQLTWVDRSGKELSTVGEPDDFLDLRLSPDGTKVLAAIGDTCDLWLYDLLHATRSRFTSDPMSEAAPVWSPDGRNALFFSDRSSVAQIYIRSTDGALPEQLLLPSEYSDVPSDWSSDGRFIAFDRNEKSTQSRDIYLLPMIGERKPIPFAASRFDESYALFSPDGKWASFFSDESGRQELYVAPVPGPGAKVQVSNGGVAVNLGWSKQRHELLYVAPDMTILKVETMLGATFDFKRAVAAGTLPRTRTGTTLDGEKFLLVLRKNYVIPPLVVSTGWANRPAPAEKDAP